MSDLIEIKLAAEIGEDSISKIKGQIEQIGQSKDSKLKLDVDTSTMKSKIKEIEGDIKQVTGAKGKKLQLFDETALRNSGAEVVKVKDTIKNTMREIENSYKSMGETSIQGQSWNAATKELEQFTVKVKEVDGVTKQYKYTLAELEGAQKAFVQTGIRGSEDQAKGMRELLRDKEKLLSIERQLDTAKKQMSKMDPQSNEYKKLTAEAERLRNVQREYMNDLKNVDSSKLRQLSTDMKSYQTELNKAKIAQQEVINPQKLAGDAQRAGRNIMAMAAPILAVGAASVKASVDYESAFAGVRKTTEATEEEFQVLSDGFRELSKVMPQSASDIAKVGEVAGQLGIKQQDILEFTEVMIMLGDSTNMASDAAADALARFANITKMDSSNFSNLGSTIVDLGEYNCPAIWKQIA